MSAICCCVGQKAVILQLYFFPEMEDDDTGGTGTRVLRTKIFCAARSELSSLWLFIVHTHTRLCAKFGGLEGILGLRTREQL